MGRPPLGRRLPPEPPEPPEPSKPDEPAGSLLGGVAVMRAVEPSAPSSSDVAATVGG
ncbi:hypothetical protein [Actinoplanes sp. NPDC048796]|uniref:hypothetical protein n=1 Tax=Actinoplanes sp. NPDC048796 TaxID=3155640 RepID=UPI0033D98A73